MSSVSPPQNKRNVPPSFLRNIVTAGRFFSSSNNDNGSSDDETSSTKYTVTSTVIENDNYIKNGTRGVIPFEVYCAKTYRTKHFHINIFTGMITQFVERKKKTFSCSDVNSIFYRASDKNVIVEIKRNLDVSVKQKRYIFDKDENGHLFKKYVEFYKEFGAIIHAAFELLDRKGTRTFNEQMVAASLTSLDIAVSNELISTMMLVTNENNEAYYDYHSFFHLFMDCEVSSIRECYLEWIQKSYHQYKIQDANPYLGNTAQSGFEIMPGEIVSSVTERVRWVIMSDKVSENVPSYRGSLYVTNYRLVLAGTRTYYHTYGNSHHSRFDLPAFFDVISIPLCTISRIYMAQPKQAIHVVSKDYRHTRITLPYLNDPLLSNKTSGLVQIIEGEAFSQSPCLLTANGILPDTRLPGLNCFAYKYRKKYTNEGWGFSDIRKEYLRQGLFGERKWQLIDNSDWSFVESYPSYFMLPAKLDASEVKQAIAHRSRGRLPVITYRHALTKAVMSRSAQPLVGITMKSSDSDLSLLNLYRLKGVVPGSESDVEVPTKFYIFDARRQIAATLNMVAGKGTEDASLYQNTDLIFCDIDNIHVMRASAISFADCSLPGVFLPNSYSSSNNNSNNTKVYLSNNSTVINSNHRGGFGGTISSVSEMVGSGGGYFGKIEESGWLRYIRLLISSSVMVAEKMHLEGSSVLIHCSDGWDRTSQICCIAQLLLDPFYRTITGFAVLIEKDWCAFGHKFQDRCGHGDDHTHNPDERSPVFLQFLDCVYQILVQFRTVFEFNDYFLCFIADHLHSGLFGNFLGNSEKQRISEMHVQELTRSIWSHVLEYKENFTNPSYVMHERPIWPSSAMAKLCVWHRYFSRWDHEIHPSRCSGEEWHDDWGSGYETKQSADKSSYRLVGRVRFDPRGGSPTPHTNTNTDSKISQEEESYSPVDDVQDDMILNHNIEEIEIVDDDFI